MNVLIVLILFAALVYGIYGVLSHLGNRVVPVTPPPTPPAVPPIGTTGEQLPAPFNSWIVIERTPISGGLSHTQLRQFAATDDLRSLSVMHQVNDSNDQLGGIVGFGPAQLIAMFMKLYDETT